MSLSLTFSRMKWNRISICLDLSLMTGSLVKIIDPLLSLKIEIESAEEKTETAEEIETSGEKEIFRS